MVFQQEMMPSFATLSIPLLLISSLFGIVVSETFFMKALSETETTTITITGMLYTPIVVIISVLFCKEILTPFEMFGGLFIISGSLLAFPRFALFADIQQHRRGYLYAVLSVVAAAIGAVTMKPLLAETDLLGLLVLRIAIALPFLMLISRWRNGCVLLEIFRALPRGTDICLAGLFSAIFLAPITGRNRYTSRKCCLGYHTWSNLYHLCPVLFPIPSFRAYHNNKDYLGLGYFYRHAGYYCF